jgi:hypothetical protein
MRKILLLAPVFFMAYAAACRAEGLDVLIEVAKSQAEIKEQYEKETKNFEKVKKGIESGQIKKGQSKPDLIAKYGPPVVSIKDADGSREDCIYKPETSSFFEGVRATLIFTPQGALDEARVEERR